MPSLVLRLSEFWVVILHNFYFWIIGLCVRNSKENNCCLCSCHLRQDICSVSCKSFQKQNSLTSHLITQSGVLACLCVCVCVCVCVYVCVCVSVSCLAGGVRVSGMCLEGVLMVSGGYPWDVRMVIWWSQGKSSQGRSCQGQDTLGQVKSGQVNSGRVKSELVKSGQVKSW